jgi:AcrR family transcriptional regulator
MVELAAEFGYRQVTVAALARVAGVSKATFYSQFPDKEACFTATYDAVLRAAARKVLAGEREAVDERDRVRRGFAALAEALAANPKAARLALVENLTAGPRVLDHVSRRLGLFDTIVADRLGAAYGADDVPPAAIRGIVAGVCHVARGCLLRGEPAEFPELAGSLLEWAVVVARNSASTRQSGWVAWVDVPAPQDPKATSADQRVGDRDDGDLILEATIRLACRYGYEGLSPSRIRAAAHVSPCSFEQRFADRSDCFLAAIASRAEDLINDAACRFGDDVNWEHAVRGGARRLCIELLGDEELARLAFVEIFAVGTDALQWRDEWVARTARRIFRRSSHADEIGAAEEASVAAAWVLLHGCIRRGHPELLPEQAETVADLILAAAECGTSSQTENSPWASTDGVGQRLGCMPA